MCTSLREAAGAPWFYEGLMSMAVHKIPSGPRYRKRRKRIKAEMKRGMHLYFAGSGTS
jgi:hypothetical protein